MDNRLERAAALGAELQGIRITRRNLEQQLELARKHEAMIEAEFTSLISGADVAVSTPLLAHSALGADAGSIHERVRAHFTKYYHSAFSAAELQKALALPDAQADAVRKAIQRLCEGTVIVKTGKHGMYQLRDSGQPGGKGEPMNR